MIPPFTELGQGTPKGYSFQIIGGTPDTDFHYKRKVPGNTSGI